MNQYGQLVIETCQAKRVSERVGGCCLGQVGCSWLSKHVIQRAAWTNEQSTRVGVCVEMAANLIPGKEISQRWVQS